MKSSMLSILLVFLLIVPVFGQGARILSNGDEVLVDAPIEVQIGYDYGDPSPPFTLYRGNYKVEDGVIKRIPLPADRQESLGWEDYAKFNSIDGIEFWANPPQTVTGDNVNLQEQTLYKLTAGLIVYIPGEEGTSNRHLIQKDGIYWVTKQGNAEGIIGPFQQIPPQYR